LVEHGVCSRLTKHIYQIDYNPCQAQSVPQIQAQFPITEIAFLNAKFHGVLNSMEWARGKDQRVGGRGAGYHVARIGYQFLGGEIEHASRCGFE
jgi:hypothetical protein